MFRRNLAVVFWGGLLVMLMPAGRGYTAPLPDPTRPPQRFVEPLASGADAEKNWQLGSILISPQRRVAVINGQPLSVGDRVDGAQVLAVEPGQVRLRRGSREFVLKLLSKRPTVTAVGEKE